MSEPDQESQETRLGRYALLEPLGEGGMARVHIARKDGASSICVLKQLHMELEGDSEISHRFVREAHIAATLNHPGIASISDAGVEGGRFLIAMEFIAGQTIEAMVVKAHERGGVLPYQISVPIMLQALDALNYAHDLQDAETNVPLGLVHRDLSPRNVMLNYDGDVKLIDFGIAKGDVDEYKTAAGVLMGTPYYMSPEQARTIAVDKRSDIYTMGVVFFEMLTGRRLVQAKGRAKILVAVARQEAPLVSSVNPAVPKSFDPVIAKALTKDADDRWPTAGAFRDALLEVTQEYANTPREVLGKFLTEIFPEGKQNAIRLLSLQHGSDQPPVEETRVAIDGAVEPQALSEPGDLSARTRTGVLGADGFDGTEPPMPQVVTHDGTVPPQVMPMAAAVPMQGMQTGMSSEYGAVSEYGVTSESYQSHRSTLRPQKSPLPKILAAIAGVAVVAVAGFLYLGGGKETTAPVAAGVTVEVENTPGVEPKAIVAARPPTKQPAKRKSRPAVKKAKATPEKETPTKAIAPAKVKPKKKAKPRRGSKLRSMLRAIEKESDPTENRRKRLALWRAIKAEAAKLPDVREGGKIANAADRALRVPDEQSTAMMKTLVERLSN